MKYEDGNPYNTGCLILLKTRFWGASKTVTPEQLGDLPPDIVHAARTLLIDTNKLEVVRGIIGEAKRRVKENTIDFPIPGLDFINKDRIEHVDDFLKASKERAMDAIEDLNGELEGLKAHYKDKHPEFYNEADYPTEAQLLDNFVFEWSFRQLNPPDKGLGILSPALYKKEVEAFRMEMKEFQDSLVSIVAKEFYDRIDKLREQCLGNNINTATVKSIHNIIDRFDNIWSGHLMHDDLRSMITQVKEYVADTDGDMLRSGESLRMMVGNKMKDVAGQITRSRDKRLLRKIDM